MTPTENWRLLHREPFDGVCRHCTCSVCGTTFTLWLNGGELDEHECCGHLYRLEIPRIDYAEYEPA